jgi:hypothetical protein
MGVTKLKSRMANRWYFGPIASDAVGINGDANPQFTDAFVADAAAQMNWAVDNLSGVTGDAVWEQWSRRNAEIFPVTHGWVDRGVKTRRKKAFVPNLKTTWTA